MDMSELYQCHPNQEIDEYEEQDWDEIEPPDPISEARTKAWDAFVAADHQHHVWAYYSEECNNDIPF